MLFVVLVSQLFNVNSTPAYTRAISRLVWYGRYAGGLNKWRPAGMLDQSSVDPVSHDVHGMPSHTRIKHVHGNHPLLHSTAAEVTA